jgi:hypothetical protein
MERKEVLHQIVVESKGLIDLWGKGLIGDVEFNRLHNELFEIFGYVVHDGLDPAKANELLVNWLASNGGM